MPRLLVQMAIRCGSQFRRLIRLWLRIPWTRINRVTDHGLNDLRLGLQNTGLHLFHGRQPRRVLVLGGGLGPLRLGRFVLVFKVEFVK